MKAFIVLTFILILTSCAKAPNPYSVSAIKRELIPPTEFNTPSLKTRITYIPGSQIFNFFRGPNVAREEKGQVAAKGAQIGLQIEDVYKLVDVLNFKKAPIGKDIESLEEGLRKKLKEEVSKYKCWVNSPEENICGESEEGELKIPNNCLALKRSPWKSKDLAKECKQKMRPIVDAANEKISSLEKLILPIEDELALKLRLIAGKGDEIINILEKETPPEKWQYWFKTEPSNFEFFEDEIKNPNISLLIQFNNVGVGEENKVLRYTSDGDNKEENELRGIRNIKRYLDGPIPTLEFEIHEKRYVRDQEDEFTGIIYKVILRENELDYGLELLGEVEMFDAHGRSLGKGMMKVYLGPEY